MDGQPPAGALRGHRRSTGGAVLCFYAAACQVPWGYYIPLGSYVVAHWDPTAHTVTYGTRPFNWGLLAFTLALGAMLFALAWRKVQDEEV